MAELISFGCQVALVLDVRRDHNRNLLDDRQPVAGDAELARVVRQQANGREPEVDEDLVADPLVALVGAESQLQVGLDRVEPCSCSS